MEESISGLRARVEELRAEGAPVRTRYTPEFRAQVLAVVREQKARGLSVGKVVRAVGLKEWTVMRWLRAEQSPEAALRRVVVKPESESPAEKGRLVVFAGNLRIEGLALAEVVELVRAVA